MVVVGARVGGIEARLDTGRDDLDFQAFVLGGEVAGDKPVQPEDGLGALDSDELPDSDSHGFLLLRREKNCIHF